MRRHPSTLATAASTINWWTVNTNSPGPGQAGESRATESYTDRAAWNSPRSTYQRSGNSVATYWTRWSPTHLTGRPFSNNWTAWGTPLARLRTTMVPGRPDTAPKHSSSGFKRKAWTCCWSFQRCIATWFSARHRASTETLSAALACCWFCVVWTWATGGGGEGRVRPPDSLVNSANDTSRSRCNWYRRYPS